jgi:hypothetical protein
VAENYRFEPALLEVFVSIGHFNLWIWLSIHIIFFGRARN